MVRKGEGTERTMRIPVEGILWIRNRGGISDYNAELGDWSMGKDILKRGAVLFDSVEAT